MPNLPWRRPRPRRASTTCSPLKWPSPRATSRSVMIFCSICGCSAVSALSSLSPTKSRVSPSRISSSSSSSYPYSSDTAVTGSSASSSGSEAVSSSALTSLSSNAGSSLRSGWELRRRAWRRLCQYTRPTTPIPTSRRMTRNSSMATTSDAGSARRHFHRRVEIDRHQAGDTGLLHGNASELARHLHGDLVVRDEHELHLRRHFLDDIAEAADVGVVERRIHLVQHAERRRVQLENGEHQRDGGQRLLAAREQVDGTVAFAGRPRHHRHARGEEILAGELQIGVPAAEKLREQPLEAGVHQVVGLAEARARLLVDLADRPLQRAQCLVQVGQLGVEVLLALGLFLEFVDRGEIDGPEPLDAGAELVQVLFPDLGRGILLHLLEDRLQLEAGSGELLGHAFAAHPYLLGRHAHLVDALAGRFQGGLVGQSLLIQFAQLRIHGLHRTARLGQSALHFHPLAQLHLQCLFLAPDRLLAGGELFLERRLALMELAELGFHPRQTLAGACGRVRRGAARAGSPAPSAASRASPRPLATAPGAAGYLPAVAGWPRAPDRYRRFRCGTTRCALRSGRADSARSRAGPERRPDGDAGRRPPAARTRAAPPGSPAGGAYRAGSSPASPPAHAARAARPSACASPAHASVFRPARPSPG